MCYCVSSSKLSPADFFFKINYFEKILSGIPSKTYRSVACLKINVRNYGDVINAFMQMIIKMAYLQIA